MKKNSVDDTAHAFNVASHAMKTPLACIIGSLETYAHAKDRLSDDEKDLLVRNALQEAHKLFALISDALDRKK